MKPTRRRFRCADQCRRRVDRRVDQIRRCVFPACCVPSRRSASRNSLSRRGCVSMEAWCRFGIVSISTVVPDAERFREPSRSTPNSKNRLRCFGSTRPISTARAVAVGRDLLRLETDKPVPAAEVLLRIRYSAEFNRRGNPAGVFVVKDGGASYVYTQFETLEARRALPAWTSHPIKFHGALRCTCPASRRRSQMPRC